MSDTKLSTSMFVTSSQSPWPGKGCRYLQFQRQGKQVRRYLKRTKRKVAMMTIKTVRNEYCFSVPLLVLLF